MEQKKREKLKEILTDLNADVLYITNNYNLRYLTGFTGSSGSALVYPDTFIFFTDFRYVEQAKKEVELNGFEVRKVEKTFSETVFEELKKKDVKRLGIEDNDIKLNTFNNMVKTFEGIELVFLENRVDIIRMEKSFKEIEVIKKAVEITDKSFSEILEKIRPGVSERYIANELEYIMKKNGAESMSFETIIASGYRSAMPHGVASDKIIGENEFVKLDFGCYYNGYVSDMTRTIFVGNDISEKHREIYNIVLEAQKLAIANAKAGISTKELDKIARDYIIEKGYGENFGHGLGHGIGLEIHEKPSVSSKAEEIILSEHMVVTIEPGIYIEGFGGVRIEDDIVIKKDGCEVLNKSSKDLLIINK